MANSVNAFTFETIICFDSSSFRTFSTRSGGISGGYACGTSAITSTPRYPIPAITSIASSSDTFLNALLENASFIFFHSSIRQLVNSSIPLSHVHDSAPARIPPDNAHLHIHFVLDRLEQRLRILNG